jgi:hypothetical protein
MHAAGAGVLRLGVRVLPLAGQKSHRNQTRLGTGRARRFAYPRACAARPSLRRTSDRRAPPPPPTHPLSGMGHLGRRLPAAHRGTGHVSAPPAPLTPLPPPAAARSGHRPLRIPAAERPAPRAPPPARRITRAAREHRRCLTAPPPQVAARLGLSEVALELCGAIPDEWQVRAAAGPWMRPQRRRCDPAPAPREPAARGPARPARPALAHKVRGAGSGGPSGRREIWAPATSRWRAAARAAAGRCSPGPEAPSASPPTPRAQLGPPTGPLTARSRRDRRPPPAPGPALRAGRTGAALVRSAPAERAR